MNPGRFYMPGYMGMRSASLGSPIMRIASNSPRSMGLFSRITNGIRSFNWSGLLSGANKTLNVVNQAIPLVRQAGPMVNNMRSMLKLAKAFGTETTTTNYSNRNSNNSNQINNNIESSNNITNINSRNNSFSQEKLLGENSSDAPVFFV